MTDGSARIRAEMYGLRLTSLARLRELERAYRGADATGRGSLHGHDELSAVIQPERSPASPKTASSPPRPQITSSRDSPAQPVVAVRARDRAAARVAVELLHPDDGAPAALGGLRDEGTAQQVAPLGAPAPRRGVVVGSGERHP
jgi:hypothetical protein